jgi:hypothetical protein
LYDSRVFWVLKSFQLYHRRRDLTFRYPQMEPQRTMLEGLGVDGMSSDEEEIVNGQKRYPILPPEWRDTRVTAWLRIFDSLYLYTRLQSSAVDARGRMPRDRVSTARFSSSKRFVAGLPINAYKPSWLEKQLDVRNIVHPGPPRDYVHDPELIAL